MVGLVKSPIEKNRVKFSEVEFTKGKFFQNSRTL